jgi:hypothetical protein
MTQPILIVDVAIVLLEFFGGVLQEIEGPYIRVGVSIMIRIVDNGGNQSPRPDNSPQLPEDRDDSVHGNMLECVGGNATVECVVFKIGLGGIKWRKIAHPIISLDIGDAGYRFMSFK